jgi:ribosome modulation factor
MRDTIEMAREACPYTSVELRGAFYDGFMKAATIVRADEREALLDLVDDYAKNNTDLKAAIRARGNT